MTDNKVPPGYIPLTSHSLNGGNHSWSEGGRSRSDNGTGGDSRRGERSSRPSGGGRRAGGPGGGGGQGRGRRPSNGRPSNNNRRDRNGRPQHQGPNRAPRERFEDDDEMEGEDE